MYLPLMTCFYSALRKMNAETRLRQPYTFCSHHPHVRFLFSVFPVSDKIHLFPLVPLQNQPANHRACESRVRRTTPSQALRTLKPPDSDNVSQRFGGFRHQLCRPASLGDHVFLDFIFFVRTHKRWVIGFVFSIFFHTPYLAPRMSGARFLFLCRTLRRCLGRSQPQYLGGSSG